MLRAWRAAAAQFFSWFAQNFDFGLIAQILSYEWTICYTYHKNANICLHKAMNLQCLPTFLWKNLAAQICPRNFDILELWISTGIKLANSGSRWYLGHNRVIRLVFIFLRYIPFYITRKKTCDRWGLPQPNHWPFNLVHLIPFSLYMCKPNIPNILATKLENLCVYPQN
jgi:hypothetical protein